MYHLQIKTLSVSALNKHNIIMPGTHIAGLFRKYILQISALYPFKMKLIWILNELAHIVVFLEKDKQKGNSVNSLH